MSVRSQVGVHGARYHLEFYPGPLEEYILRQSINWKKKKKKHLSKQPKAKQNKIALGESCYDFRRFDAKEVLILKWFLQGYSQYVIYLKGYIH